MSVIGRPGPRTVVRGLRLAHSDAMLQLATLAQQVAETRPWEQHGRPKGLADDDLIEDVEWMLQNGTSLEEAARRMDLSAERLRKRLEGLERYDLLARLRRDAA